MARVGRALALLIVAGLFVALPAYATAPSNDNFAGAQAISGLSGSVTGTNVDATKETGEPNHAGNVGGASVWYSWTAPATGQATFATAGSSFDTLLAVYRGTIVSGLSRVAANDDVSSTNSTSQVSFAATGGITYMIAVDGWNAVGGTPAKGNVALTWSQGPPAPGPANDNFASAQIVSDVSGSVTGTNVNATKETGEPNHAGNVGGASVWYSWTAPSSGQATFTTAGSSFDTLLAAYRGTSVSALTAVAANDDASSSTSTSQIGFAATGGVTYMIAVDGWSAVGGVPAKGNITLGWNLGAPVAGPPNDNFASAQVISGAPGSLSGTNVNATKEAGEPNHASNVGGASVWYSWTAPSSGQATFATAGSNFDTLLAVYRGTSVSALTGVAANDDVSSTNNTSQVSFAATGGVTYTIAVDGWSGGTLPVKGNIALAWQLALPAAPANDNFAAAQTLSGSAGSVNGTSVSATKETDEPNHAGNTGGASVWYSWTAPASGQLTLSTAGSSFNTLLAVYTGSAVSSLSAVASNDDASGSTTTSQVSFAVTSGATYMIAVDGFGGAAGNVTLAWQLVTPPAAPANDNFAAAQILSGAPGSVSGTNVSATKETGEPSHASNVGGASVWYRWTAPSSGQATFSTAGSGFNTLLAAYTGSIVSALTPVASNDDASSTTTTSQVSFAATSGITYMIAVDGSNGATDGVVLAWSIAAPSTPPANDMFAAAQVISDVSGAASGANGNATKETGEPNHVGNPGGASIWYSWTAPSSGQATFATAGSSFDTLLAVYRGTSVSALTAVAANDDANSTTNTSQVSFAATGGVTYMIAVDGWSAVGGTPAKGTIALNWSLGALVGPPANDNFAAAQPISGLSGSVGGTNVNATKEIGEPIHASNVGGASVWYAWTAPTTGSATIGTAGSSFDTLLAVYKGTSVSALTQVAANDDVSSTNATSQVILNAVSGTTYMIAVDGWSAGSLPARGSIVLGWTLTAPPAPTNDNFASAFAISGPNGSLTGTNVSATKETGEPNHAGNAGGASVWFSWSAPASGQATLTTAGSAFNTLLAVYTGTSVSALTQIAANDDASATAQTSFLTFNAVGGTVYRIAVDGYNAGTATAMGSIALAWQLQTSTGGDPQMLSAGDIASCTSTGDTATAALLSQFPNATVATIGDHAYQNGTPTEFSSCYDPTWGVAKARTKPVPGDHDYGTAGASAYYSYFGAAAGDPSKGYYSYDIGSWHVVALNTVCGNIGGCGAGSPQQQWLKADLAAHPNLCTVAIMHDPLFSSGGVVGSVPEMLPFWQDFYAAGVDLVLAGHAHNYERFAPQTPSGALDNTYGIREIIAGTGGVDHHNFGTILPNSLVRNANAWGVVLLTLHTGGYDWKFVPVAGQGFNDSGTASCHGTPPPPPPPGLADFGISVSPTSKDISHGHSVPFVVTVSSQNGFAGTVGLSISGLPSLTTATFTPTSISGSGTSQLVVFAGNNTPHAAYSLTIQGTSGSLSHTVVLNIKVT